MAFIDWNGGFSVGVGEMDEQHKKMIGLINSLHEAMSAGRGKEVVGDVIREIASYARDHFSAEEALMMKYGYPQLSGQQAQHKAFVQQAADLEARYAAGSLAMSIEVLNFLKKWWTGHILDTDKKYAVFFSEKGVR